MGLVETFDDRTICPIFCDDAPIHDKKRMKCPVFQEVEINEKCSVLSSVVIGLCNAAR